MRFFEEQPIFILDHQSLDILDVNDKAVEKYGYTFDELTSLNVSDLGNKYLRTNLIDDLDGDRSSDKVWQHTDAKGKNFFVQFTYHLFNHNGTPARLAVAHDVTELVERDEKNRSVFPQVRTEVTNSPLAVIEWNEDLTIKQWSEKAQDLFGWTEDEVVGREDFFEEFVYTDEVEKAKERFKALRKSDRSGFSTEGRNHTKSGDVIHCEWYNSVLLDKNGSLVSIYAQVHDISERKQSENLFRALSEEALVGVYLIQDGVFKYINPRFADIFGYEINEIQNKLGPLDLAHPKDSREVKENIQKRIEGGKEAIEYDFRCLTKDEQVIHVNVYGSRTSYQGKPAIIGTLVDITDSKLAYERYRASVESFEDLFDSISDAIYIQDKEGKFLQVNQGAVDMYGFEREEFIGRTPEFLAAPGKVDMEKTLSYVKKALNGNPQTFQFWGIRKNGEVFPKEVTVNPGTYFGEDVVIAIARDVSERYEAQEQMRRNEEMFRQLFQNAHIGIAMLDERQEIQLVNDAFENIFGYESEEVQGLDIDKAIVPESEMEEALELSQNIFAGKASEITGKRKAKDGSLIDVLVYGVPVIVAGHTVAIFGMYVDITDRKDAEERLRRSLKEKEVLLAEIHHRVKNNLAVITGLLELQRYSTPEEDAQNALYESQMRVNSIALIHEKLYQSEDLSQISFDVYIEELSDIILKSLVHNKRDIQLNIDADAVELTINQAIPCGLILNEIITNSFKHAFKDTEEGSIDIIFKEEEDKQLTLIIEDDGSGLPENLSNESTDSLGMTLISTLTKQLNGESEFIDTGNGTRFELEFKRSL